MGGGLESRCVGRVYGADGAVRLVLSSSLDVTNPNHFNRVPANLSPYNTELLSNISAK